VTPLDPRGLAALAALALPLALHLWSSRPRRVIRVGSVRDAAGIPAARRLGRRLDDPLRFALRAGALVALALALAGLRAAPPAPAAHVVVPAVAESAAAPLLDSLRAGGVTVHHVAPGPPVWPALAAADAQAAPGASLVVIAPPWASLLGAYRPALTRAATWRDVAARPPGDGDAPARVTAVIVTSAARRAEGRVLRAALEAARAVRGDSLEIRELLDTDAAPPVGSVPWLAWLSEAPLPAAWRAATAGTLLRAGGTTPAMSVRALDDEGRPLLYEAAPGDLYLAAPLTAQRLPAILTARFADVVAGTLPAPVTTAADTTRVSAAQRAPARSTLQAAPADPSPRERTEAAFPWWLLAVACFAAERASTWRRRRG